jgi:3-oxoacyl-(acyl-carrier-protein) synthase
MTSPRRAVVTGVGVVGPAGIGLEPLAAALAGGEPLGRELPDPHGYRRPGGACTAARCPDLDLDAWLEPGRARRMSQSSKWAVAASRMALEAAGQPRLGFAGVTSVALATSFGPNEFTERLLVEIERSGPRTVSPFLFTDCVANAPAGQVAIDAGATGPNHTVCQREAGALLALVQGAADVAHGRADRSLVVSVDEMAPLVHAMLDRFGALCRQDATGCERPRPFDRHRTGFLASEGATALLLEDEAAARGRGARVFARVRAAVRGFDPTATRANWGRVPQALIDRVRAELARQGLGPADVAAVVSGAAGARDGDRAEARLLHGLWGAGRLPPVVAPKATLGEYGGGVLAPALLALAGAPFARPRACSDPDPALDVALHDGSLGTPDRALLTALAAGGSSAFVVLERPEV